MLTSAWIKQQALTLGFEVCGVAPATALPELAFLPEWLARGYAGDMIYLHKSAHARADIRNFLPSARSVIVAGAIYNTDQGSGIRPAHRSLGEGGDQGSGTVQIARYARGQDYHIVLAERLEQLVAWMREQTQEPFETAIFVDKHHVQERVYAQHAGIGWIGKNSCVINPELGSYMFLCGIAISVALDVDRPATDQCGACTLCLDSCPTGAIVDEHVVDATKCISYLTIEVDGAIPEPQRPWLGNHAYGCDICQEVCPYNLAPVVTADPAWTAAPRDGASAAELWQRTDAELHDFVKGSAMTHLPLSGLRRNLAIVIGNAADPALAPVLDRPGHGVKNAAQSAHTPAVEDAVAWAKGRLK
ncbi:MAG: tRNA epoxyqueuosine(34) reductase QueG [Acidobacteriota bacterium]|nr:tRNA epoxyqueuosine(34) reductase QueG [Acidobacteriota bacterium]